MPEELTVNIEDRVEAKKMLRRLQLVADEADWDVPLPILTENSDGVKEGLYILGFDIRKNLRSDKIEICRIENERSKKLEDALRHLSEQYELKNVPADSPHYDVLVQKLRARDWIPINDDIEFRLLEALRESFRKIKVKSNGDETKVPYRLSRELWTECLHNAANMQRVDPFVEWLNGLEDWDMEDRCEQILQKVLRAEDSELTRWAGRAILIGAIKRAFEPGAKIDEFPVLIGEQGCGKSAFVESLIPPRYAFDWFGDRLELDADGKQQAESIKGRVIVEVAEMVGRTKADIEKMKAMLSRRDDGQHRGAYARHAKSQPRQCIFVGTANDHVNGVLPPDPTGLRRFVAIDVIGPPEQKDENRLVEKMIDECREQLWAEAYHKFLSEEWSYAGLPRELREAQAEANQPHATVDTMLEDMLCNYTKGGDTLSQLAVSIGFVEKEKDLDKSRQYRLGDTLKRLGWTKKLQMQEGVRRMRWYPPEPF